MHRVIVLAGVLAAAAAAQQTGRFPKPDPQREFAELKYCPGGACVRAAVEDWDAARSAVASDARAKAWFEQRRGELDEWMSTSRDKAEYVAGWWHDFVNEKDGAFLEWTPQPPAGVTEKVMGGWVFGLRSRNGERMVEAARVWRVTGERKYFDWAAAQLDFYAENYARWPLQTLRSRARLMHQSLDDANMLIRFVQTARLLDPAVEPSRREVWTSKLIRPMAMLLDETFQRVHNIACWQRSAMAMAAIYAGDAELWKRAVDGEFGVRRQVRDGITSEYLWIEQSLLYNSYVVSAFLPLLEYAGLAGRLEELKEEAAAIQNLMLAPIYMRFPKGKLPTPADSTAGFRTAPELGLFTRTRAIFPARIARERADGMDWTALLDAKAPSPQAVALPQVKTRNMESSRMAILRKGDWQVFFHYGQVDPSHAQAEALNYEAFHGLIDVTHDPGTVGYGSPLHTGFYKTGAAHNTVLVDGLGQAGWNPGVLVGFDAEQASVTARQEEFRPGVSVERSLEISGGSLVETTRVKVKDGSTRRLALVVHVQGSLQAPASAQAATGFGLPYWTEARSWDADGAAALTFTTGVRRFGLNVASSKPMKATLAKTPDAPPATRESLHFEVEAAEAEFRVVWSPR